MSILSILNELAADNSKLAKIAILTREKQNVLLQRVFKATYDPGINYWLIKIPEYHKNPNKLSLDETISQLQHLADRVYTGKAGQEHLAKVLGYCTDEDAIVIERIVQRDLKVGCSDSTANKVWPNLIPEFSYMRCALPKHVNLGKWNWKDGIYSQEKADALFCNVDVFSDGEVVITTRAGSIFPLTEMGVLVSEIQNSLKKNTRTHGELMVVNKDGIPYAREISNGIMNSVAKGGKLDNNTDSVRYVVWDQIPLINAREGKDYNVDYNKRFDDLSIQVKNTKSIQLIQSKIVYSFAEAFAHYQEMLAAGKEGTVIKTRKLHWKDGTSKEQIKFKLEACVDLEIVGFNPGNGKFAATFGSIKCQTVDGLLKVNVSGIKDKVREEIWKNRTNVLGKIMAVKSNCIMYPSSVGKPHSLFLPRMAEIRDDKKVADTLQQVIDQFDSLMKGA